MIMKIKGKINMNLLLGKLFDSPMKAARAKMSKGGCEG
jgi:hypothetical protein